MCPIFNTQYSLRHFPGFPQSYFAVCEQIVKPDPRPKSLLGCRRSAGYLLRHWYCRILWWNIAFVGRVLGEDYQCRLSRSDWPFPQIFLALTRALEMAEVFSTVDTGKMGPFQCTYRDEEISIRPVIIPSSFSSWFAPKAARSPTEQNLKLPRNPKLVIQYVSHAALKAHHHKNTDRYLPFCPCVLLRNKKLLLPFFLAKCAPRTPSTAVLHLNTLKGIHGKGRVFQLKWKFHLRKSSP